MTARMDYSKSKPSLLFTPVFQNSVAERVLFMARKKTAAVPQTEQSLPVACYTRVSTENQLENYSIPEQTERLRAFCRAKGWQIVRIYSDPGFSGANTNRPALRQLIRDLDEGVIRAVVVYKLDRLSRSQKDTLNLIEDEFSARGVDFVSVLENFDTSTPFGRATLGMLSVFAQLEKDQITDRFRMGRIGRAKAGLYHGGPTPPTGYDYIDGKLVINAFVASQVREAYDMVLRGKSINATWRAMHEKYGGWASATMTLNVLRNPVYIGKINYLGQLYDGQHDPIIDPGVWHAVQNLLESPERESAKKSPQKTPFRAGFLLSSLLFCKHCGARYSANHGYYKCYSRSKSSARFVRDPKCKNTNWVIEEADRYVISLVDAMVVDPEKIIASASTASAVSTAPDEAALREELASLDKQTSRLLDLCQSGAVPMEQVAPRLQSLNEQRAKINGLLSDNSSPQPDHRREFLSAVEEYKTTFAGSSLENKRLILRKLISLIEIDKDNIYITWRI